MIVQVRRELAAALRLLCLYVSPIVEPVHQFLHWVRVTTRFVFNRLNHERMLKDRLHKIILSSQCLYRCWPTHMWNRTFIEEEY